MQQPSAFQELEVSGVDVCAALEGCGVHRPQASALLLAELGTDGEEGTAVLSREHWYPLDGYLRALARVGQQLGEAVLHQAGLERLRHLSGAEELTTLEALLDSLDGSYHRAHRRRGGPTLLDPETGRQEEGIGHYRGRKLGIGLFELVSDTPYPCAFDQGLLQGGLHLLGTTATLIHDDGRGCRAHGAKSCTFLIRASPFRIVHPSAEGTSLAGSP